MISFWQLSWELTTLWKFLTMHSKNSQNTELFLQFNLDFQHPSTFEGLKGKKYWLWQKMHKSLLVELLLENAILTLFLSTHEW